MQIKINTPSSGRLRLDVRPFRPLLFACLLIVLCSGGLYGENSEKEKLNLKLNSVLEKIEKLELASAYVELKEIDKQFPGQQDVQALLVKLTLVLEPLVPANTPPKLPKVTVWSEIAASDRALHKLVEEEVAGLLAQKNKSPRLHELAVDTATFCRKNPNYPFGWQLLGRLACALDDEANGRMAATNLLRLGVTRSQNPEMVQLMLTLHDRGWISPN